MNLSRVNPGDPIRASDYNALVEAVEVLMSISAGTGMRVTMDAGGPKVALSDDRRSWKREGKITGVFRDGLPWVDDGKAQDPTRITYAARPGRSYEEAEIPPAKWKRVINRPNTRGTVTVFPAKVGHECEIWRIPAADGSWEFVLELKTEEIEFVAKCKDPSGKSGSDGTDGSDGPDGPGTPGGRFSLSSGLPGGTGGPGTPGAGPGAGTPGASGSV